ncbi:hypothetical protein ACFW04_011753 [Cataglyphis niger]
MSTHTLAERARERITSSDSTLGERAAATAVWAAMKTKTKFGIGRTTATRKRTLPAAKRGGFLPLLPLLGVLGSLAGGAAGIARAVNDGKATRRRLEELQRHNRAMEDRGLYLAPYKRGSGASSTRKKASVKKKFRGRR